MPSTTTSRIIVLNRLQFNKIYENIRHIYHWFWSFRNDMLPWIKSIDDCISKWLEITIAFGFSALDVECMGESSKCEQFYTITETNSVMLTLRCRGEENVSTCFWSFRKWHKQTMTRIAGVVYMTFWQSSVEDKKKHTHYAKQILYLYIYVCMSVYVSVRVFVCVMNATSNKQVNARNAVAHGCFLANDNSSSSANRRQQPETVGSTRDEL